MGSRPRVFKIGPFPLMRENDLELDAVKRTEATVQGINCSKHFFLVIRK